MLNIKQNVTAVNQWSGRGKYRIKGICMHSCWGTYAGTISWFKNPVAHASTHYVIKKDGEISLTILEENTAWAQGVVTVSQDKAPKVIKDNWGVNPNFVLVSVEAEDEKNKNWNYPSPQYTAAVNLIADICRRNEIEPTRDYIIMHKEIDPINRTDPVGKWNQDKFVLDVAKLINFEPAVLKEIPCSGTVHVRSDITGLNIRDVPVAGEAGEIVGYWLPKQTFNVVGYVHADMVENEDRWWVDENKHYEWSGGTVEKPDNFEVKGEDGEYKMTQTEKDALLAELNARVAEVNEAAVDPEPVVEVPVEPVVEDVAPAEVVVEAAPEVVAEPVVEELVEEKTEPSLMDQLNSRMSRIEELFSKIISRLGIDLG